MRDDIDRECCASVEAVVERGLKNSDGQWKIVDREFRDPGILLYLQHNQGPKVRVSISYNWDER